MNYSHFVGLDIGKKTLDASLMSLEEKELSHKSFVNSGQGIEQLKNWVSSYGLSLKKVLFCAENMGNYVTDLCLESIHLGFDLTLVCPLTIKKSIGLQRGKNDRIDAKRIASYACLHHRKLSLYQLPDQDIVKLRSWIIIRNNLVKQKVATIKLQENIENASKLSDMADCSVFLEEYLQHIKNKINVFNQISVFYII